ncbi:MAG: hypothetical protein KDJ25_17545 [Rhodoblastus sp.]|nr:hypothetical protein [Rhodoblastus sp.]
MLFLALCLGALAVLACAYPLWTFGAARPANAREKLLRYFAGEIGAPEVCDAISRDAFQRYNALFAGGGASYARSDCYEAAALRAHDAGICRRVRPLVDFDPSSSHGYSALGCARRVLRNETPTAAGPNDAELLTAFAAMGYDVDELPREGVIGPAVKPRDAYVTAARNDTVVARAKTLLERGQQTLGDAETAYLASLVAAATRAPEWCERIPRGVIIAEAHQGPFRDWCVFTLASDTQDPAICDALLPARSDAKTLEAIARGVAPAIAEQLSLQHQCRRQANRTSTGAVYGAQAPSDPALTRRLLSLLGQTAPSARALPPERQADYYRQFLYVLWPGAQEGDAVKAARAKLVARLIALPAPP